MSADDEQRNCQRAYDRVADEYIRRIFGELAHKPLDRELLDRFAVSVGAGLTCDMGCGPGQVARYLLARGTRMCGVDLSEEMVNRARELNPGIDFQQGDMRSLNAADGAWAGMTAFYSLIHVSGMDLVATLREFRRVLQPGGLLLVGFHIGEGTLQLEEWWGHPVQVSFHFFQSAEMAAALESAGFEIQEIIERDPYPDVEHQSRRSYIFARVAG